MSSFATRHSKRPERLQHRLAKRLLLLLLTLGAASDVANGTGNSGFTVTAGQSGGWYDPSHEAEGYVLEVLSKTRALVDWFTYDREGKQRWMIGVGDIEGTKIRFDSLLIASDGKFGPDLDPDDVIVAHWGEATFALQHCSNEPHSFAGHMRYVPAPDFGPASTQSLDRLTLIHGVECDLPQGLTGWWPGDGHAHDVAGGRTAQLRGDAKFGPGMKHSAFILDGVGDFIEIPEDGALNFGTGDFTVDLWVKFHEITGEEQVLVEKWVQAEPGASTGWVLTKLGGVNVIRLALSSRSSGEFDIDSGPLALPAESWLFFTARRIGNEFTIFLDGVPIAGLAVDAELDLDTPASLKFGARGAPDDRGFFLNGAIDEVRLTVGRALSNDEIADVYREGVGGGGNP